MSENASLSRYIIIKYLKMEDGNFLLSESSNI